MHNKIFPPNINPQIFSLSATLVGALLVEDYSVAEQSAIGNWLMLVSQYIITHAAEQNLIETRLDNKNININKVIVIINFIFTFFLIKSITLSTFGFITLIK